MSKWDSFSAKKMEYKDAYEILNDYAKEDEELEGLKIIECLESSKRFIFFLYDRFLKDDEQVEDCSTLCIDKITGLIIPCFYPLGIPDEEYEELVEVDIKNYNEIKS